MSNLEDCEDLRLKETTKRSKKSRQARLFSTESYFNEGTQMLYLKTEGSSLSSFFY